MVFSYNKIKEEIVMKKSMSIIGSALLVAGAGYGAWAYYKKHNPLSAYNMKKMMRNMTKDMEKEVNNMM